jgi:tRNA (guanosine-2'-O-)-methyltransferase
MFPYQSEIEIDKNFKVSYQDVLTHVWPLLTEERRQKITRVASERNFNVSVVLENIYDRGNASAVMRSQEAFGFGCVEVIEGGERFKNANRVSSGAEKWLRLRKWSNTTDCWKALKAEGCQICVTSLQSSKPIEDVDWTRPTALVLGNEKEGVSQEILDHADERIIIPMVGFVQSLNISVAGAVSLYHVSQAIKAKKGGRVATVNEEQIEILKAHYAIKTLDSAAQVLRANLLNAR